ncbi:glutathione peroxidase [Glaciecola sp. XM2]|jgi:glutathione peroxidase|uniref:glutathione peroxidase n=1 Tax=Glaciecola sp. XM2 TaxID=1914931 RepID=UPI001BDF1EEC|nr:glutathione peroxidase [Glaciecola sp. XM2]MBT1449506.1 glutathione peroxidase [Glaciecola sp. XM2]
MKTLLTGAALLLSSTLVSANECPDVLKHMKRKLNSQEVVNLCEAYSGKAVLFVNTASKCGFTPQFEGLEALYTEHKDEGFVILGFPSNDFAQEYADESKTAEVCELTYGVNFPMFEPISVRGDSADPLYAKLAEETGKSPKWNFNKYLMDKNGNIAHYGSRTRPDDEDFLADINKAIAGN